MVVYLDDMLFLLQDSSMLTKELQYVSTILSSLGFIINAEKSIVTPTQQLEFLRFFRSTAFIAIQKIRKNHIAVF